MYFARRIGTNSDSLGIVRGAASVGYINAQLTSVLQTIAIAGTM